MNTTRIAVITAGLSQPSSTRLLADRLAEATTRALAERDERAEVDVIELRALAHDITDNLLTGFAGPSLQTAIDAATGADGLIAVTPVFTASYSGLFKSFFDVIDKDSLAGTPVLIAATAGSARHSMVLDLALRPLFAYLRAVVVPLGVFAASEDWGGGDVTSTTLPDRVARAAAQLADLLAGHGTRRDDPFTDVIPFEERLRRLSTDD